MQIRLGLAVTAALMVLGAAEPAAAAITVANQNDSGPGSLRQAIADAPPGETINVPPGTYSLTSGQLNIEKGLTIAGNSAADTIVRSAGPFRVLQIEGEFDVSIRNLTVRDGSALGPPAIGGGLLSAEANLTLSGVSVTNNTANANGTAGNPGEVAVGAGILAADGKLELINSSVTANTATAVGGSGAVGGTAVGAGLYTMGALTILNTTISGNIADARGGQGPSNAAQKGGVAVGGGLVATATGSSRSSVSGSTISGNVADASSGPGGGANVAVAGGISGSASDGPLAFTGTTIAGNVVRATGSLAGGVAVAGGIVTSASEPGTVEILGSTIAGNRIEAHPEASAVVGGNLLAEGDLKLGNTVVANGSGAPGSENCVPEGEISSLGFNLETLDQCGFKGPGDKVNTDPQLGPLQSNGGPTQTMAPALSSPAIDQGAAFGLTADQRGVLRPIDLPAFPNSAAPGADGSDIGAVEFQPSNALVLGKLKRNKKKGTATLTVFLPQPSAGTLILQGKGLKRKTKAITGQAKVRLKVAGKRAVRKALRRRGRRKVQIKVTYAPTGNEAATKSRKAKLVKKKPKKKRGKRSKR